MPLNHYFSLYDTKIMTFIFTVEHPSYTAWLPPHL